MAFMNTYTVNERAQKIGDDLIKLTGYFLDKYKIWHSSFFTWIRESIQRYRTVGTVNSVAALAAWRPAPVVGPSAAAVLVVAVVTAAAAPSELTALPN
jgi:hypothetical protein